MLAGLTLRLLGGVLGGQRGRGHESLQLMRMSSGVIPTFL